jgi:hypothetical protein
MGEGPPARIGTDHGGNLILSSSNATIVFGGPLYIGGVSPNSPGGSSPNSPSNSSSGGLEGAVPPLLNVAAELAALRAEIVGVRSELAAARANLAASDNMTLSLVDSVRDELVSVRQQVTQVSMFKTCADVYSGSFYSSNWTLMGGPVMFSDEFATKYAGYCAILGSVEVIENTTLTSINMTGYLWRTISDHLKIWRNSALTFISLPDGLSLIGGSFWLRGHDTNLQLTTFLPNINLTVSNDIDFGYKTNVINSTSWQRYSARVIALWLQSPSTFLISPAQGQTTTALNIGNNPNLEKIVFEESILVLSYLHTSDNPKLTSLVLPQSLISCGDIGIARNIRLHTIIFPPSMSNIRGYITINGNAVTTFTVGAPLIDIRCQHFVYCNSKGTAPRPANIISNAYSGC